jgi:sulfur-carrier protein adenylyltransferase/sulfurtransferase
VQAPRTLDPEEMRRYSRQVLLDEVGVEGQLRLKEASVVCVGAGGLGSPVLIYLAAAGVGRIGIVDFDRVERSNLQRQVVHGTSRIGSRKTESAAVRLLELNPAVKLDLHDVRLGPENALDLLRPYNVVVDGTDNLPARYLLDDATVVLGKPFVYGAIHRFEGQVSVFNHQGGPTYRDLFPEAPDPDLVPSCAEFGVLGVVPAVIGAIQATETLKILLGVGSPLSGRLLLFDALQMRFREIALARDPSVPRERQIGAAIPSVVSRAVPEPWTEIGAKALKTRMDAGWKPFVLDIRRAAEACFGCMAGTDLSLSLDAIGAALDRVPRDRDLLVVCRHGLRSVRACALLSAAGFESVFHLQGGLSAWAAEVDPELVC